LKNHRLLRPDVGHDSKIPFQESDPELAKRTIVDQIKDFQYVLYKRLQLGLLEVKNRSGTFPLAPLGRLPLFLLHAIKISPYHAQKQYPYGSPSWQRL